MELHELTDSVLVTRLQADDDAAFEELLRRYKRPVINFCYRLLGNEADADDIAQETFVRLHQQRAKIDPAKTFTTWLFALARNASIDRLRYRQRHPTDALDAIPEPATLPHEVENRELEAAIATAIAALPEDQRTAIVLAEYHGLGYAEIAGVMKSSAKSVESRLYRAKQALRISLRQWLS